MNTRCRPHHAFSLTLLAFTGLALISVARARAETFNVGPSESIAATIDDADNGDEIVLGPGTYEQVFNPGGKALTIRSSDGPAVTIFNGKSKVTINNGEGLNTIIQGITFQDTNGPVMDIDDASGPAIVDCIFNNISNRAARVDDDSTPTFTGCRFDGTGAANHSGMDIDDGSIVTLNDCIFTNHVVANNGAAIISDVSTINATGCTFSFNDAGREGGAIFYEFGIGGNFTNCTFDSNHAGVVGGGAISNRTSSPTFDTCTFNNNDAMPFIASGGAIRNEDFSSPAIVNCTFTDNFAESRGGAIFSRDSSSGTIENCTFENNTGEDLGGAIALLFSSSPDISGCTFRLNFAGADNQTGDGGAIQADRASSPPITNCLFEQNEANGNGGAVFVEEDCTSDITDCVFDDNIGAIGGGIAVAEGATPTIGFCTFNRNTSVGVATGDGAGIHNRNSDPTIHDCVFRNNAAEDRGGGITNNDSNPVIRNCRFIGNTADSIFGGGGMYNEQESNPSVVNCAFIGNAATNPIGSGGGMYNDLSAPTVANCIFSGNTCNDPNDGGGGMINDSSDATIINCTFSGNTSGGPGGGITNVDGFQTPPSFPVIQNCIVFGNTPDQIADLNGSAANVTFSDIQDGFPGVGNINTDPRFVDADGPDNTPGTEDDDLRLANDSPAIDAADNDAVPADTGDLDDDADLAEALPFDLDKLPRFFDVADSPDTGNGTTPIVDMGAFESQGDVPGGGNDDQCPDDPNKTEPGLCGCGVPDVDRDNDGTCDDVDGCPDDPNKAEPGECGCGNPDTDSDGDGVADCNDVCDGFDDTVDTDGDGTPDGCDAPGPVVPPAVCGFGTFNMMPLALFGVVMIRKRRNRPSSRSLP
ncbi:MAG: right-handed parallel beta-helix repeat-containing protein [Phycisphaerales bacterium]|nr:right-handed parallel beta-helix repeat-containing protein [Phycisphaerales bacterium]